MHGMSSRVGGEIDTYCGRCKLDLAHTILAMVGTTVKRVRCNTCGSDHGYRSGPPTPNATRSRPAGETKTVLSFAQRVATLDPSKAKRYSTKTTFGVDDLVDHATFGLGIVTAVRLDKIDVTFKAFQKTLVHQRAASVDDEAAHNAP